MEIRSEDIQQVREAINVDLFVTIDELAAQNDLAHGFFQKLFLIM